MQADFWHKKWESNVIGFHLAEANPLLLANFDALALKAGERIFIPLCGKTLDIAWLLSEDYQVVGVELSAIAVDQLFTQLSLEPTITNMGELKLYHAENIDIFVGDIFHLTQQALGAVDAIYDRAAFVALPEAMRARYTKHLIAISNAAPQLLISFEYDQSLLSGPPFATTDDEIKQHYQQTYALNLLTTEEVQGGLKGKCPAVEHVWLLA